MQNDNTDAKLMFYDPSQSGKVIFYVLGGDFRHFLNKLPIEAKIRDLQLMISTDEGVVYADDLGTLHTVSDFTKAFEPYFDAGIDHLKIELENGTELITHDDMEVTLSAPNVDSVREIIQSWLNAEGYDAETTWNLLRHRPKQYILTQPFGNKMPEVFENFDTYLEVHQK
jgi:hypothetical protein